MLSKWLRNILMQCTSACFIEFIIHTSARIKMLKQNKHINIIAILNLSNHLFLIVFDFGVIALNSRYSMISLRDSFLSTSQK